MQPTRCQEEKKSSSKEQFIQKTLNKKHTVDPTPTQTLLPGSQSRGSSLAGNGGEGKTENSPNHEPEMAQRLIMVAPGQ